MREIEKLVAFPANANPYHHDSYNMGQAFSKEWHMMYKNHTTESADCGEELPPLDESILKNATYSCLALCDTCFKQEQQRIKDIDPDTLPF